MPTHWAVATLVTSYIQYYMGLIMYRHPTDHVIRTNASAYSLVPPCKHFPRILLLLLYAVSLYYGCGFSLWYSKNAYFRCSEP